MRVYTPEYSEKFKHFHIIQDCWTFQLNGIERKTIECRALQPLSPLAVQPTSQSSCSMFELEVTAVRMATKFCKNLFSLFLQLADRYNFLHHFLKIIRYFFLFFVIAVASLLHWCMYNTYSFILFMICNCQRQNYVYRRKLCQERKTSSECVFLTELLPIEFHTLWSWTFVMDTSPILFFFFQKHSLGCCF